jgi:hypothetical protein
MTSQTERRLCTVYISPDERKLLAKVANGRGIGRDYLALRADRETERPAPRRPIPRWLGQSVAVPAGIAPPQTRHVAPQARHCRSCALLLHWVEDDSRRICSAGIWTQPMRPQSVDTSRRLRMISSACTRYTPSPRPQRAAPHHCRACCNLAPADTIDERYVCGCRVWNNPMTALSVANARRLTRLSAACADFEPSSGHWLPRSRTRA